MVEVSNYQMSHKIATMIQLQYIIPLEYGHANGIDNLEIWFCLQFQNIKFAMRLQLMIETNQPPLEIWINFNMLFC